MTAADRDPPDLDPITNLVETAMHAHLEGGEAGLAAFCAGLGAPRAAVIERLDKLRRMGLLGEVVPAEPAAAPERIGDFELIEPLGRGGMGVVYLARQLSLDREVALKMIRPEQLLFPGVRERFQREVAIIARLQHEGIVKLYSFGEERGIPWFAMERIRGCSLADVIASALGRSPQDLSGADLASKLPEAVGDGHGAQLFAGSWIEAALTIMERAALALDDAHRQGVLHRDIKPSNIMLTASGRVVLLDFGLAWSRDADRLTRSGAELGTIHYMAPEQFHASGATVDERTDVYALGVVLRELLTLRPAFDGSTIDQVAQQVRQGLTTPFARRGVASARELETICLMAMDRDPARRYATPRLLARDLRNHLEHRPIAAVRPTFGLRLRRLAQRHRAATLALLALLAAALLAPFVIAWHERRLRQDLEIQIERADRNLTLAADALSDTLTRFEDEDINQIPDLAGFVDQVLVNSNAFLDSLLASNPADPAARLRLATVVAKIAHVRWGSFDLPRTEPLFARVLDLIDGIPGDFDQLDELELATRLALVYVRQQVRDTPVAAAAYRKALARVQPHGDFAQRPLALRQLIGRSLERLASLPLPQHDVPRSQRLSQARALFRQNAAAEPSVTTWLEVARIEYALIDAVRSANGLDAAKPHEEAYAEALGAAEAVAATATATERQQLADAHATHGARLQSGRNPTGALAALQLAEAHQARLLAERPSRISGLRRWIEVRSRAAAVHRSLGHADQELAIHRGSAARAAVALVTWPTHARLLISAIQCYRLAVESALARGTVDAEARRDLREASILAERGAKLGGAVLVEECSRIAVLRGRVNLLDQDPTRALAEAATADQLLALAHQYEKADQIQLSEDPARHFLAAEALLRLGREQDAQTRLSRIRQLPANLLELVPALQGRQADPAFATTFARVGKR
jgi:serine/threonine protein kinase